MGLALYQSRVRSSDLLGGVATTHGSDCEPKTAFSESTQTGSCSCLVPRHHFFDAQVSRIKHLAFEASEVAEELLRQLLRLSGLPIANKDNCARIKHRGRRCAAPNAVTTEAALKAQHFR